MNRALCLLVGLLYKDYYIYNYKNTIIQQNTCNLFIFFPQYIDLLQYRTNPIMSTVFHNNVKSISRSHKLYFTQFLPQIYVNYQLLTINLH